MSFYANKGKRALDLFFIFISLVLLSPLLVLVSVLIKIFDPGPIIFKQKRIGFKGELFDFYKFRSMPVNTKDLPSHKIGSLKLTSIGKLIRRTSIDELPQLFNILKGDMSLVGPRPAIPNQKDLISLRSKNNVFSVLPGLTGLAQISSYDGMTNKSKVLFDAKYCSKISLLNDLKIILKTFTYLLKPPPVY